MKEFKKWLEQKTFYNRNIELKISAAFAWKASLNWYQSTATKCEKDCSTDED